jgi:hypothetical protein
MGVLTDIAGNVQFTEVQVTVLGPALTQLCQARPNRYSLGIAAANSISGALTTLRNPAGTPGFKAVDGTVYWFTVKDHGPLAQAAWFMSGSAAGAIITVWEVFVPRE